MVFLRRAENWRERLGKGVIQEERSVKQKKLRKCENHVLVSGVGVDNGASFSAHAPEYGDGRSHLWTVCYRNGSKTNGCFMFCMTLVKNLGLRLQNSEI